MSVSVKPLGAGQEVGRSCVIVTIKDVKIMFDCGVHMVHGDNRKFPDFRKIVSNSTEIIKNKNMYANLTEDKIDYNKHLDLLIITHFHLDHCGALPYFTEVCGYTGPIITSQPTKAILPITLEDFRNIISDYRGETSILRSEQIIACMDKITTMEIGEERIINNRIKVTSYYAGHVLGAGIYKIEVDGYSVIYTGDYNTSSDRHLAGAYVPKLYADIFITETTYGDTIRDTKRAREREFLKKIQSTIDQGGKVLIPIFALGRAQELCILLDTYWRRTRCEVPIYFAGPLAEKANFYYKLFVNWTNQKIQNMFQERNVFDFSFIKHADKSVIKGNQPMVIFATPGMLHGGLSLSIFKEIAQDAKNCVIIPGYCTAGTVGNKILSGERQVEIDKQMIEVRSEVYYMSFSAHADAKGLLQLIKNAAPKNVVLVHGDAEVMKKFQKSVESSLYIKTTMPANHEEIFYNVYELYYRIDMSVNLYKQLDYLFNLSFNNNFKRILTAFPAKINDNITNSSLDNHIKIEYVTNILNLKYNNNKDIMNIFQGFISKYHPKIYSLFSELIFNNYLTINIETKKETNYLKCKWRYPLKNSNNDRLNDYCCLVIRYLDNIILLSNN